MKHSKSRIESFSDGVFAFAATLIVVSFEVPDNFEDFKNVIMDFLSFGLSFLALALLWKVHYNMFRRIEKVDDMIIGINFVLLFVILFYVYPMKFLANTFVDSSLISNGNELAQLFVIYGIGFVLMFLFVALIYRYAIVLENDEIKKVYLKYCSEHFFIFVLVGLFSVLLSYFGIGLRYGLSGFSYILLGPICYWYGKRYGPET